ncbi:hypothetical protein KAW80_04685, partial [Candidatus Babeliales bacterium]|nr:hypothetical protein [Candidatus Babeliales bacterium]
MKIVVIGGACLIPEDISKLEKIAEISFHDKQVWDEGELIKVIGDSDIIVSALVPISKKVISAAASKNLKLISLATTGFNGIDLDAACENKVTVCYAPGYATEAVAEHAIGLMLAVSRMSFFAANDLRNGIFDHCRYTGKQLINKTLGIVGWGRIGQRVAEIAKNGFGMKILYTDKDSTKDDFENLLKSSDVISLHVPFTKETENLLDESEFQLMKDGAIIINTARGGIINEDVLVDNLKNKKVFGAGLDVLKDKHPGKDHILLSFPNVIVTPHMSYNSEGS